MKKYIFVAAAVTFSSTLQAQDTTKLLNMVVVTANKFPNKTTLTGKVLTVITRDQLDKSGGQDLARILTEQAGIFVSGANSNPGKDKSLYLRGAKYDHTLISVDGVPLYDASGIGSNFDIRLISIDNIERIEILKGGQSTLYGSDAIAGVVNIIMKKAGTKPVNVAGVVSYGSYNSMRGNASINGSAAKMDYNVAYSYFKTNGINETVDTLTVPHITDKDGYNQHSVYAALGFKPAAGIRVQPYIRYTKYNGDIDQGAFTDELDYSYSNKNLQVGIKNEFAIGKGLLNVLYNYNSTKRNYIDDSVKSQNGFAKFSEGNYNATEHFADAYIVYPLDENAKLTAGIDYRHSNTSQDYSSISFYGPFKTALGKDSVKQNQFGLYTAFVVNTKSGLSAELGGRFNHHSEYGTNFVFNVNPSLLIKEQFKLFINVSSAYKTPTLYQLYSEYGNKKLAPETAISFESGVQIFSRNSRFNTRLVYFSRDVKDAIAFFTNPASFASNYINQDKQQDHGFEIESALKLGKTTSLKMFYSYVDGEITTKNNGRDTTYYNLIRRPRSSFGFTFGSNFTRQLYVSTSLNAVGKSYDNSFDASFNPVKVKLAGYALINLYTEYSIKNSRYKFFLDLHNITDAKFTEIYGFNTMGFNSTGGIRFTL